MFTDYLLEGFHMRANDERLLREAIRNYYRSANKSHISQPSVEKSKVIHLLERTYIVLISASCILKLYHLKKDGSLKCHKHIPRELKAQRLSVSL